MSFSLVLWDLGGQNEFITTHHLFLDVAATTLVVMDITIGLHHHLEKKPKLEHPDTPAEVLSYWLNTIHNQALEKDVKPNIALVLTHKDMVQTLDRDQYIEKYIQCIEKYVEGKPYARYITRNNIFVVDNKTGDDADFSHLRNKLIHHLANQKSWGFEMPIPWHKLKADVIQRAQKAGKKYLSLTEVVSMATEYGMNKKKVNAFLKVQNSLGDIIHYSSPNLQEVVITDPQWLVDMCKALITHPSFLDTRNLTSSVLNNLKQGQVTDAGLQELWKGEAVDFSKELLIKFKLIVPLNFTKSEGRRYLIPSMLPSIDMDMYEREPFKSMYLVYNALQNPKLGDTLLIGTFHKLLAECSQTENWELCAEDHLSYTDASFQIQKGIRLALTLLKKDSFRASRWSTKDQIVDSQAILETTRRQLDDKMKHLQIEANNTYLTLCPHSKDSDAFPCLVQTREYLDPRSGTYVYRYLKQRCTMHQKRLFENIQTLLILVAGKLIRIFKILFLRF